MSLVHFLVKAGIYLCALVISYLCMDCVQYEKILKKGHVKQAQFLYFMFVIALAYLVGSFICVFIYI